MKVSGMAVEYMFEESVERFIYLPLYFPVINACDISSMNEVRQSPCIITSIV